MLLPLRLLPRLPQRRHLLRLKPHITPTLVHPPRAGECLPFGTDKEYWLIVGYPPSFSKKAHHLNVTYTL